MQERLHRASRRSLPLLAAGLLLAVPAGGLAAQTDYYNTDAGRPVRVEDAFPTERYAFELQLAPLRLERGAGGVYSWSVEPEVAYGILPQTHVEVGFPLLLRDAGEGGESFGLAGIEVSALHNLNVETRTLPAFAVAAEVVLPVGRFHPGEAIPSLTGIATRTFDHFRVHANARYSFAPSRAAGAAHEEPSRWMAGVAVDRTFPLRSLLLIADLYAHEPLSPEGALAWNAGAGVRYQWSPRLALDAGVGKGLAGDDRGWFLTLGSASRGRKRTRPSRSWWRTTRPAPTWPSARARRTWS